MPLMAKNDDNGALTPVPANFDGLFDASGFEIKLNEFPEVKQELIGFYKGWAFVDQKESVPPGLYCLSPDPAMDGKFRRLWYAFHYQGEIPGEKIDAVAEAQKFIDGYTIPEESPIEIAAE